MKTEREGAFGTIAAVIPSRSQTDPPEPAAMPAHAGAMPAMHLSLQRNVVVAPGIAPYLFRTRLIPSATASIATSTRSSAAIRAFSFAITSLWSSGGSRMRPGA